MRAVAVLGAIGVLAAAPGPARADHESDPSFPTAASAGPTLGLSWGRGVPLHLIGGVEAGVGFHYLLYGNAGLTWRDSELFSYVELDGWYAVGATAGFGYGSRGEWQAVLGVWEAVPLADNGSCNNKEMVVASFGYRWTGLHELYVAGKYGEYALPCSF